MEKNTVEDEEVELLDNNDEDTTGVNYCNQKWQEILKENDPNSFWRTVAGRSILGTTGAQILSKWRICPVVQQPPQAALPKFRTAKIGKMLDKLNTANDITEDDVTELTLLIIDEIEILPEYRSFLRLRESINTYISAVVKLKYSKKDYWTEMDWTTAIYASLQNFFWSFQNRSNSIINSDHFPTWVTPDVKPDFCSSNKRPFLVAEYGIKRKAATHKDLFKLLQTMRSIIRRWQLDYPKQSYGNVYGILIGGDRVTALRMTYDATHDVYSCCVYLNVNAGNTWNLSTSVMDIFTSLNVLLSILQEALLQRNWVNKALAEDSKSTVQPAIDAPDTTEKVAAKQVSSNKSPTRHSDNSRINSSTSDASMGEVTQRMSSNDNDSNSDANNGGNGDHSKDDKKTTKKTTNVKKSKQKQINIEELYTVNDPELLLRTKGMFVVVAELTKHARKVIQYFGAGDKFLAKFDHHKSPVEVLALKRIGSDNKKFIHPWATELINGVHVTLFEWKENKIHEACSNINRVKRITRQLLEALADVHKIGICHGDIKFDNVIDTGHQAYLVDFNLAYEPLVYQPTLCGTLGYRAPEAVKRNFYSQKADIYAFGICVIEVLIGKPIYSLNKRERDELKFFEWIRDEIVPSISDENLRKFVSKCLAEDENLRPTAAELLRDEFFSEQPSSHKDSKVPSKVRQPLGDVTNKVY